MFPCGAGGEEAGGEVSVASPWVGIEQPPGLKSWPWRCLGESQRSGGRTAGVHLPQGPGRARVSGCRVRRLRGSALQARGCRELRLALREAEEPRGVGGAGAAQS